MSREGFAARLRDALVRADELALVGLLEPDVRLVVDSGDDRGGEWGGRARVARALLDRFAPVRRPDASLLEVHVNGCPGLALRGRSGAVHGVLVIGEPVLYLTTSPRKLAAWNRRRPDAE